MIQAVLSVALYANRHKLVYNMVTILRHDMQLKRNVAPMVLACARRFCAPFPNAGPGSKVWPFGDKSRVPDTWQTMPWKIFGCFLDTLVKLKAWPFEMIGRHMACTIGEDKIGFLDVSLHADSDPYKN